MKRTTIMVFLCMNIFILCSCEFTKWDTYDDIVGEWVSLYPLIKNSKLIFYEDGTCIVENVPIKETDPLGYDYYTLFWYEYGNEKTKEKVKSLDKWNFHGYWKVKEDTLYEFGNPKRPYYRYRIQMSPHLELLETEQACDSFLNHTHADDAFLVHVDAWTNSFFPPARLHNLSFYTRDPDNDYWFSKETGLFRILRMIKRYKERKKRM